MGRFVVWDPLNESEETATAIDADGAEEAAEIYMDRQEDYGDGFAEELHVRCPDDAVRVFAVTTDYDPVHTVTEQAP